MLTLALRRLDGEARVRAAAQPVADEPVSMH